MGEETEQIRRETEAKWSGALSAITKALPSLLGTIAIGLAAFNGCKEKHDAQWIGQHLDEKQKQINQLEESK